MKNTKIITSLRQKNNLGEFGEPTKVGTELKYIKSLQPLNFNNFEEIYLTGLLCETRNSIIEDVGRREQKSYKVNGGTFIITTTYKNERISGSSFNFSGNTAVIVTDFESERDLNGILVCQDEDEHTFYSYMNSFGREVLLTTEQLEVKYEDLNFKDEDDNITHLGTTVTKMSYDVLNKTVITTQTRTLE